MADENKYMFFDGIDRPMLGYYDNNLIEDLSNTNFKYARAIKYNNNMEIEFGIEIINNPNFDENLFKNDLIENKIKEIKDKAYRIIVYEHPEWKQRNMIARAVELNDKQMESNGLEPSEVDEKIQMKNIWQWIKNIRSQSNQMENEINLLTNVQEISDYKINYN